MQLASDYIAAEHDYQKFLITFPANPSLAVNERFFTATVNLAVCQIHQGKRLIARKNLTNLLRMVDGTLVQLKMLKVYTKNSILTLNNSGTMKNLKIWR